MHPKDSSNCKSLASNWYSAAQQGSQTGSHVLLASASKVSKLPGTHSRVATLPFKGLTVNTDRKRSDRSAASLPKLLSSVMTCGGMHC